MRGVSSFVVGALLSTASMLDAFAPLHVAKAPLHRGSRDSGMFMAEYSLQGNNVDETVETPNSRHSAFDEQRSIRWDTNTIINNAILYGLAGLVLAKLLLVDSEVSRGWTVMEVVKRVPMSAWDSYMNVLTSSPVSTKAVTSASVYTIGDVIAQQTEGASIGELDRMRVLRSMLAGLIGHGPLSHLWYNVSDKFFDHFHLTSWWSFLPKIAVDQAVWSPIWNNTYLLLLGLMKREKIGQTWEEMKRTTIPLMISGLKLWPLAHVVTYGLIPVENRLLWVDMIEIIWVSILATSAGGGSTETVPTVTSEEQGPASMDH